MKAANAADAAPVPERGAAKKAESTATTRGRTGHEGEESGSSTEILVLGIVECAELG